MSFRVERFLWLLIAVAHAPYLVDSQRRFNSDMAVVPLMARHIRQGEHALFFWGNRYMAAYEAYATAALSTIVGSGLWVANLVTLSVYATASTLLVSSAARGIDRAARAFLLVFVPPALVVATARPGFSSGSWVWLTFAALIALRPALEDDPRGARSYLRAFGAGIVLLLGVLYVPTVMLGLLALGAAAVVRMRRDRAVHRARFWTSTGARVAQLAVVGMVGVLGLIPGQLVGTGNAPPFVVADFLQALVKVRLLLLSLIQFSPFVDLGAHVVGLNPFYAGLPVPQVALPGTRLRSLDATSFGLALVLVLLLGVAAWRSLRRARNAVQEDDVRAAVELVFHVAVLALVAASFVLNGASSTSDPGDFRYTSPAFFSGIVLLAALASSFVRPVRLGLAAIWAVLVVAGHATNWNDERAANADLQCALDYATRHDITAGIGDYWLAYNLTARTDERLVVAPRLGADRYPAYLETIGQRGRATGKLAVFQWLPRPPQGDAQRVQGETRITIGPPMKAVQDTTCGEVQVVLYQHGR